MRKNFHSNLGVGDQSLLCSFTLGISFRFAAAGSLFCCFAVS